jgi:UPF0755 protein
MWRHIASNFMTLIIVGLFLLVGGIGWGVTQYTAPGPLAQAICFQVQSGSNMSRVAQKLSERDAIASEFIFETGADYSDRAGLLKAGSFLVPEAASMDEIVSIVTRGGQNTCGTEVVYRVGINRLQVQIRELDPATSRFVELASYEPATEETPEVYTQVRASDDTRYRVALAEGVTSWQIVNALSAIDFMVADVPEAPAEGSLAPDSYDILPDMRVSAVVAQMAERQATILATAWAERADGLPLASPEEALILASIVEKETGIAEERRQVASVFVNRLNQGMKLQTDPTVIYGITQGEGILGRGLRQSELRGETPWNTYVIPALPPTPIANPGRASIEAALNPDSTPFIFFVADGTGGHAFATTLEEHNRNVARWREIEAERSTDK